MLAQSQFTLVKKKNVHSVCYFSKQINFFYTQFVSTNIAYITFSAGNKCTIIGNILKGFSLHLYIHLYHVYCHDYHRF